MKYYIIAGEKSGDSHGSNLVKALKEEDQDAHFQGFGGDKMHHEGVNIIVHIKDLAIMGFSEVLLNLRKIRGMLNLCKSDIRYRCPTFNHELAGCQTTWFIKNV